MAGKTVTLVVGTYCIRPHDLPPRTGVAYHAHGFDPVLAQYLRGRYAARPSARVQNDVWRLIDAHQDRASSSAAVSTAQ